MADEKERPRIALPRPLWLGLVSVLVIVTGIALRVGIPSYRQRAAIQVVDSLGGSVESVVEIPDWIEEWFGDGVTEKADWLFRIVINVRLGGTPATDDSLSCIRVFAGLRRLNLDGTQVTDAGLQHLKGLTKLTRLYLDGTQVTDAGLEHLMGLANLESLSLDGTQVNDVGLEHLKGLTKLEYLFLDGTQVTPRGVAELKLAVPKLHVLGVPAQAQTLVE
jgi:internalin A